MAKVCHVCEKGPSFAWVVFRQDIGGTSYVLAVIAAIAIGGTNLRGGEGAVWRTVVGVLFLGLVTNGLGLLNVDPTYYQLFTGLLILAAIGVDATMRRVVGDSG